MGRRMGPTCRHEHIRVMGSGTLSVICQQCFKPLADVDLAQWWERRQPPEAWPLVAHVAHEPGRALYLVRGTGPATDLGMGVVLEGPDNPGLASLDLDDLPFGFRYVPLDELLERRWTLPLYEIDREVELW